jgi:hypothetical protein
MMVQSFVAAFAKAARVSDVPEEAIMSDTREPSYMFLAAEWNRSSVSERAYLLAMLFGREFEVEANDLSLQIARLAMTMVEPDGSAALYRARRPWRSGLTDTVFISKPLSGIAC